MDLRIRIRIHIKMLWIRNTAEEFIIILDCRLLFFYSVAEPVRDPAGRLRLRERAGAAGAVPAAVHQDGLPPPRLHPPRPHTQHPPGPLHLGEGKQNFRCTKRLSKLTDPPTVLFYLHAMVFRGCTLQINVLVLHIVLKHA
jgi:hypothetical protein